MARPRKLWYRKARRAVYVEIHGRQKMLAKGPDTKETWARAQLEYHRLMAEILANPPVDGGNPTVASVIDAFLEYAIHRDAETTFYERKLYLQAFAEAHGGRLVADCVAYHLTSWIDAHSSWQSDSTRSYAVRSVKRPFNWAVQQGLIPENPFAAVAHRPGRRRRPMTSGEYNQLLRAAGPTSRLGEILRFLRYTGCRPSELRKLCWKDIHWDRKIILLTEHKTSRTQREYQPRIIPLVPKLIDMLSEIRRRQEHDNLSSIFAKTLPRTSEPIRSHVRLRSQLWTRF